MKFLEVHEYDTAERNAASNFCNRINQAFYPEMFSSLGYPMKVDSNNQLWKYVDVMHEVRTDYNIETLLRGLTIDEFELFKVITKIVDQHAKVQFGKRMQANGALLRAIHFLRLIKIAAGTSRPAVLEIGPGSGYLAMLCLLEGFPYIGTDITQPLYLYQNHMLNYVAKDVIELVTSDKDLSSFDVVEPCSAVHVPWWKWISLNPENIQLDVGIVTCNHVLCEMHPYSLSYFSILSKKLLSNNPNGLGKMIFDSWGYDGLHSQKSVYEKLNNFGFNLCHNDIFSVGLMIKEKAANCEIYEEKVQDFPLTKIEKIKYKLSKKYRKKINNKQRLVLSGELETFLPKKNSFSIEIINGLNAYHSNTKIDRYELFDWLKNYYDGKIPTCDDDVFFDLIGVKTC